MNQNRLKLIPVTVFAVLALFLWRGLYLQPQLIPTAQAGKPLPEFELPLLDAHEGRFSSRGLKGQVALLNVWASWCAACEEEQVFLMSLATQGLPIYGLNYKDETDAASKWLAQWGNPYRLTGQDKEGKTAIDLGIYGTPETFLLDAKGNIVYRHVGVLNERIWKKEFEPLINRLRSQG